MQVFRRLFTGFLFLALTTGPMAPQMQKSAIAAPATPLDLNTATLDQLKALPGMGDAYAKRILRARPYTAKTQLTQRGVIPPSTYARIRDFVIARQK
jgi:competence protein ComEA